ncbi:MAG TPA: hypothetical protein VLS46_08550, partial [Gaiellaceae bacterium]|nr:hypothetical protein [Gaiellaceae bacterium]
MQHEVVSPAGNGERVELDRAQAAKDVEHRIRPSLERARGRERVARHEEAACGLGTDVHRGGRYRCRERELRPGLWHWQAPHPGWEAGEPWDPNVSSYALDDGEQLLLFDPLAVPSEL